MNNNQLTTKTANGNQATTSTPQQSTTANNITAGNSSSLQPGTTTTLLNNKTGVDMGNTALTYVNLGSRSATATSPIIQPTNQAPSTGATLTAIIFFAIAAAMVINVIIAGKKTTE